MKKLKWRQYGVFIVSAVGWLAIDLATKYYLLHFYAGPVIFIKRFFYITLQKNNGVALGIRMGYGFQMVASMMILGMLIYYGWKYLLPLKRNSFLNQFLLGIIVGGAIGNLVNRIHLGAVIDFIVLKPFPVFNLADVGITLGLIALFFLTYKADIT
ncbi:signal peptidase II [Candidatus Peregrinibacteria bacterium]|nr:signal peptidase II [Candidatus Peregrinibacteria bacterium]